MNKLSRAVRIKDLLILQSPQIFNLIKGELERGIINGVNIGNLIINPYIYETRSLNVSYLLSYIKAIANVSEAFRYIFNDYLYNLYIELNMSQNQYNLISNDFHIIFDSINNKFNSFIIDQYLFEAFGLYQDEVSVDTITSLYKEFNNLFKGDIFIHTGIDITTYLNKYIMKYIYDIYDKIFEQFEPIYLPFY